MMATEVILLKLPFPPSVNHYWRHVGCKVIISKKGREYREAVAATVKAAWIMGEARTFLGRLKIVVAVHAPDKRERDLDNLLKSLLDSLQHAGLYKSDSQIDELTVVRYEPQPPHGFLLVKIDEV